MNYNERVANTRASQSAEHHTAHLTMDISFNAHNHLMWEVLLTIRILQMSQLKLREANQPLQSHSTSSWQSWNLTSGCLRPS